MFLHETAERPLPSSFSLEKSHRRSEHTFAYSLVAKACARSRKAKEGLNIFLDGSVKQNTPRLHHSSAECGQTTKICEQI